MREEKPSIAGVEPVAGAGGRGRRRFLQQVSARAAAALGGPLSPNAGAFEDEKGPPSTVPAPLPTLPIGSYRLTRRTAVSNPISGYSHSTRDLSEHMKEYFTHERIVDFVERCEKMGINAWHTGHGPDPRIVRALGTLRERGSKVHWLCLAWEGEGHRPLGEVLALKPIAVVHHGGVTDRLFRAKQAEKVHDFVKKVHDAGVLAGVSSHNPDHVAFIRVDAEPVGQDGVRLVFTFKEMPSWFPILSYVYTEENGVSWGAALSAGNRTGRDLSVSARVYFGDLEQQWSRISWPWIRGNHGSFDFYGARYTRPDELRGFEETSYEFTPEVGTWIADHGWARAKFSYFEMKSDTAASP